MSGLKLAQRIARLLEERKGEDVAILDLRGRSPIADFFVISTASSPLHAQSMADFVETSLNPLLLPHHIEGYEVANWILLDYWDVVVHIFLLEVREFYGLERLWGDAPRVEP